MSDRLPNENTHGKASETVESFDKKNIEVALMQSLAQACLTYQGPKDTSELDGKIEEAITKFQEPITLSSDRHLLETKKSDDIAALISLYEGYEKSLFKLFEEVDKDIKLLSAAVLADAEKLENIKNRLRIWLDVMDKAWPKEFTGRFVQCAMHLLKSDELKEFWPEICAVAERHLTTIVNKLKEKGIYVGGGNFLKFFDKLVHIQTTDQTKKLLEALGPLLNEISDEVVLRLGKSITLGSDSSKDNEFVDGFELIANDPESQHRMVEGLKARLLDPTSRKIIDWHLAYLSFKYELPEITEMALTALNTEVAEYGLDGKKCERVWRDSYGNTPGGHFLERNVSTIRQLEARAPGSVRVLNQRFGIYDFGRYPIDVLLNQYETANDDTRPYGIVFFPRVDHNASFYSDKDLISGLHNQLGETYLLRILEGDGKLDMVKMLARLDRAFGNKHKITFAVIGGHGTKDSIQFGGDDEKHSLRTEDLTHERFEPEKRRQYFIDQPTFILFSCSTGLEGGIAAQLSKELGANVLAPDRDTAPMRLMVDHRNDGSLSFNVTYSEGANTRAYV